MKWNLELHNESAIVWNEGKAFNSLPGENSSVLSIQFDSCNPHLFLFFTTEHGNETGLDDW